MSAKNLDAQQQKSKTNPNLKSSIVHKPFATGTVNFFNPYRKKSDKLDNSYNSNNSNGQLISDKLFLNAELEKQPNLSSEVATELTSEIPEIEYHDRPWFKAILNPWSMSAIAIIFLANLISGAFIWRNYRLIDSKTTTTPQSLATLGSANLAQGEFVPLNLSTLSRLETTEDVANESLIAPISPALAPISHAVALSSDSSDYHYVLTEYTGEQSLAKARQKVQQVSLVNFPQGVFIYLGAFRDREQAQEFVSQLTQEGFAAQVYPFDR